MPSLTADDPFFDEWLAAGQLPQQIPVSAVCNARCLFCSNRMNPFPIKRNLFRDIDSIKLQLSITSARYSGSIYLSDSLPGRISEGEVFLHPRFFEILSLIRGKFLTNRLHITTNASLLDAPLIRSLEPFRPLEIDVSMHSARPELWARIFQRPRKLAHTALRSLALLKKYHIDFTGTIVPLPRICGWDDIEETFMHLVAAGAKSITLWWPGITRQTPSGLKQDLACPWPEFEDFMRRMEKKFPGYPVLPQPILSEIAALPVERIMKTTLQGNLKTFGGAFGHVLWLASEAACTEISRTVRGFARDFTNEHRVYPVENKTYGGNIRVSGLLMVPDFLDAGKKGLEQWPETDLVLLPKEPFDIFFRDLQKAPAYRIPELLGKPVWVVFKNGDYHPLMGRGFVRTGNNVNAVLEGMISRFDASVSKKNWEEVLDYTLSFPICTSSGLLKRNEFKNFLMQVQSRLVPAAAMETRTFEKFGEGRVLCIERWSTADPSHPVTRWFLFRKAHQDWKVETVGIER